MNLAHALLIIFGLLLFALPLRTDSAEQSRKQTHAPMAQKARVASNQSVTTEAVMNLSDILKKTMPAPSDGLCDVYGLKGRTHTLDSLQIVWPPKAFWVPKGVILLSRNKPVTSSTKEPKIGELAMITDGDKAFSDGSFVELDPGLQWVQLDLQTACEVYAVVIWHFHAFARVYFDVVVQCADDAGFTRGVKSVFNNDHDGSAGFGVGKDREYRETNIGKLIDFKQPDGKPAKTRYLRFYSNGHCFENTNHYIEVEVYGRSCKR